MCCLLSRRALRVVPTLFLAFALAFALFGLGSFAAAQPAKEGVIRGIVIDGEGRPLAGATVTIPGPNVTLKTDKGGLFGTKVKPGSYKVTISAAGFSADTQTVTVKAGAAAEVSALLMKK